MLFLFFFFWIGIRVEGLLFIWLPQGLQGNDDVTTSFTRCGYNCIIPIRQKQHFQPCNEDGLQTKGEHISHIGTRNLSKSACNTLSHCTASLFKKSFKCLRHFYVMYLCKGK